MSRGLGDVYKRQAVWKRPPPDCIPTDTKAAGLYMICTLSKHEAEKNGFTDALMLDYKGRVSESTGSNIFLVINGEIHTPVPDCFLNGITRQAVIEIAKNEGMKVIERDIYPDEIKNAEEIFLTGSAVEVTPVGKIDNQTFKVGDITAKISSLVCLVGSEMCIRDRLIISFHFNIFSLSNFFCNTVSFSSLSNK